MCELHLNKAFLLFFLRVLLGQVTKQESLARRPRHKPLLWVGWAPIEEQRLLWPTWSAECPQAGESLMEPPSDATFCCYCGEDSPV